MLSEEQAQAAKALRANFSHIETPSCSISAWLTPDQQQALTAYRKAFSLQPKEDWNLSQLPESTTEAELALIEQLRALVEEQCQEEHDKAFVTDLRLLQYLRARDHHLDKAHAMLLASLAWRREHEPWKMENVVSRTDKTCSDARIVGYDRKGRVVVYSSFANTTRRTPTDVQINAAATMEKASLCVNAGSPGSLIWVNNFGARHKNGFGWRDCNPSFFFSGIDIFSNHYPECLQVMIIVDPPSIFFNVWSMIKPLLPIKTQEKAMFVDSRQAEKTRQQFLELFGEELGEYLIAQVIKDAK